MEGLDATDSQVPQEGIRGDQTKVMEEKGRMIQGVLVELLVSFVQEMTGIN